MLVFIGLLDIIFSSIIVVSLAIILLYVLYFIAYLLIAIDLMNEKYKRYERYDSQKPIAYKIAKKVTNKAKSVLHKIKKELKNI